MEVLALVLGTKDVEKEIVVLTPFPKVATTEKETEPSVPTPEVLPASEEIEPPVSVSDTTSFKIYIFGQEDIRVPMVEPAVLVSEERVDPIVKEELPRGSVDPQAEAGFPIVSSEMTTLTVTEDEPPVLIAELTSEPTNLHPFLPLHKVTTDRECPFPFLWVAY